MKQILEDELTTKVKVIKALEGQCKSWLGARMRFKDFHKSEWEPQFQKQFRQAFSSADASWKDRAAKLLHNFEHEIWKSLRCFYIMCNDF
jgi:hypothetical protein